MGGLGGRLPKTVRAVDVGWCVFVYWREGSAIQQVPDTIIPSVHPDPHVTGPAKQEVRHSPCVLI